MGLLAIPTGAATFGYFENGTSGAINFGLFGLIVMVVLIVLVYRTDLIKSAASAIWIAICYVLTAGLSLGIAAGLAFGLSRAHVRHAVGSQACRGCQSRSGSEQSKRPNGSIRKESRWPRRTNRKLMKRPSHR